MKQKIGILLSCLIIMSYLGLSPVLADIASAFPKSNVTTVQMLITLPSLMTLILSVAAGRLARYIYKRYLILFSFICYLLGGLLPLLYHGSLAFLLLCTGILGVGCGILVPITAGIICDYYEGEERNQMMGLQGAAIAVGGMVFTLAGGFMANLAWQKVYLIYLLLVPCFVVVFFTLPQGKLEQEVPGEKPAGFLGQIWFLCLVGCLYYICNNAFNTNIAMYMEEQGLGGAQSASLATAIYNFAGIFAGIFLGKIMKLCKKYTVPLSFGLAALGMLLTFWGNSLLLILVGGVCVGYAFATYTAAGNLLVSDRVSQSQRSLGIACLSASNNIGATFSPVVINAAAGIFAPGVRVKFLLTVVVLAALTVVTVLQFFREKD